jgi:hypothetical protein
MTSFHEDQKDKHEYFENEKRLRREREEQPKASTYHGFAESEAAEFRGRFKDASGSTHVVGSTPRPEYPEAAPPWQKDLVPREEPTGYDINRMPEHDPPVFEHCTGDTGGAADEPSGLPPLTDVDRAAPPSSRSEGRDD